MKNFIVLLFAVCAFGQNPPPILPNGPVASMPACSNAGQTFYATDTKAFYLCGPAGTWTEIGGGGGGPTGPAGGSLAGTYPNPSIASSVSLPGSPTTTTQTAGNNTTSVATTAFVQSAVTASNPAVAVLAASIGSNITGTYANGTSGIGATFTVTATGAFSLDGVAINTIGQRVLLKDQTSAFQNGVYTATVVGATAISPVFTRATDYNQPSDINSTGAIPVQSGTVNATTSWLLTSTVNTVGTDALTYVQFTYAPRTSNYLPPYVYCGASSTALCLPGDNGYQATLPSTLASGWGNLSGTTTTAAVAGGNGDWTAINAVASWAFLEQSSNISSSIEMVGTGSGSANAQTSFGIFVCDQTNNKIITLDTTATSSLPPYIEVLTWTVAATNGCTVPNTPASVTSVLTRNLLPGGVPHLKIAWSGGTVTVYLTQDGGPSLRSIYSASIGTVASSGIISYSASGVVYSLKVQ